MDSIFFPIFDFILYIYNSIPVIEVDWVEILSFYKKCFIGIIFLSISFSNKLRML